MDFNQEARQFVSRDRDLEGMKPGAEANDGIVAGLGGLTEHLKHDKELDPTIESNSWFGDGIYDKKVFDAFNEFIRGYGRLRSQKFDYFDQEARQKQSRELGELYLETSKKAVGAYLDFLQRTMQGNAVQRVQDSQDANTYRASQHFHANEEAYKQAAVDDATERGKAVNYPPYTPSAGVEDSPEA